MNPFDASNTNSLWCSALVETWGREGLTHAVVCPGSRSTPLTLALVRHPTIQTTPVLDERSAGFFALGLARASHRPVVLVCTSGSAGAHFLPAVIEAHEARVPLIIVTADRPPELRDCAAGQTINQHHLYGNYTAWYHELALPELALARFTYLRQTARQTWRRAQEGSPVHLNTPFRDPLPPLPDEGEAAALSAELNEAFWTQPDAPFTTAPQFTLSHQLTTQRGLIIAGQATPADPAAYAECLLGYARATGWPILADALSPVRHYATDDVVLVAAYDTILRNEQLARDLTPRYVLGLEGWPTSKVLRQWLERTQAEMLLVSPHEGSRDAVHGRTREITAPATSLRFDGESRPASDYAQAWAQAESQVQTAMTKWMASENSAEFEGRVAWQLGQSLGKDHCLVLASSMPVRDWEYFTSATDRGLDVHCSRGANGIDGTLSTAAGVAAAAEKHTVLLTGDLALLHDSNGLALHQELSVPLTVIVINNQGGGIFEHLPVAEATPDFERYFATPQQVNLAQLCAAHDVPHRLATPPDDLVNSRNDSGIEVIEIRTDRKADAATRKRLFREWSRTAGE
jgi:2-succinyl-5-enolpyruvyl-6-hydroxy-3-cyclohexene-1-carboxylate synthase